MYLDKGLSQAKRAESWLDSKPQISIVEDTILKLNKRLSRLRGKQLEDCTNTIKVLRSYISEKSRNTDQTSRITNSRFDCDIEHKDVSNVNIRKNVTIENDRSVPSAPLADSHLSYEVDGTVRALSGKEKLSVFESLKAQFGN